MPKVLVHVGWKRTTRLSMRRRGERRMNSFYCKFLYGCFDLIINYVMENFHSFFNHGRLGQQRVQIVWIVFLSALCAVSMYL